MYLYVHCSLIHSGQYKEITEVFFNDQIKKMGYIYTVKHYSAIRKDKILTFVTMWMNLENIMLSEIDGKIQKQYGLTSKWHMKLKTINEQIRQMKIQTTVW